MKRNALIMGASGDIGSACAYELAAAGFSLYLHYFKNQERISQLQRDLTERYPNQDFFMVSLDMKNPDAVPQFCQQLFALDTIVFAQGGSWYGLVSQMPQASMAELWQVHLETPVLLLQHLEKKLARASLGRVIFIGSLYGEVGSGLEAYYAAVKSAQVGFVKSYAQEVATLGITANVVAPGAVQTHLLNQFSSEELGALQKELPLLRLARPEEIAYFVGVCAAEKASYLTGSVLNVNGGWH